MSKNGNFKYRARYNAANMGQDIKQNSYHYGIKQDMVVKKFFSLGTNYIWGESSNIHTWAKTGGVWGKICPHLIHVLTLFYPTHSHYTPSIPWPMPMDMAHIIIRTKLRCKILKKYINLDRSAGASCLPDVHSLNLPCKLSWSQFSGGWFISVFWTQNRFTFKE